MKFVSCILTRSVKHLTTGVLHVDKRQNLVELFVEDSNARCTIQVSIDFLREFMHELTFIDVGMTGRVSQVHA